MVCSPALPLDLNRAERNPSIPCFSSMIMCCMGMWVNVCWWSSLHRGISIQSAVRARFMRPSKGPMGAHQTLQLRWRCAVEQLRKQVTQAPSLTLTLTSILENIAPRVWCNDYDYSRPPNIEGPGLPSALLPISIIHHHSYHSMFPIFLFLTLPLLEKCFRKGVLFYPV